MPICHIVYHKYKTKPSQKDLQERSAFFQAAFSAAPFIEQGFVGHYVGPEDYDDVVCVTLKDLEAFRTHMTIPHGRDEAAELRKSGVVRATVFDIVTPDMPADTEGKIKELYKSRWELFPDVAKVLREEIDARMPYL